MPLPDKATRHLFSTSPPELQQPVLVAFVVTWLLVLVFWPKGHASTVLFTWLFGGYFFTRALLEACLASSYIDGHLLAGAIGLGVIWVGAKTDADLNRDGHQPGAWFRMLQPACISLIIGFVAHRLP